MHVFLIEYEQGCLEKNIGTKKAPNVLAKELKKGCKKIEIVQSNPEESLKKIFESAKKISGNAVFLGGDHSITYSLFKAFAERKKNPAMVFFDSHSDCLFSTNVPTHEDFLRKLIEDRVLKKEKIFIAGLTKVHSIEKRFLKKNKIKNFSAKKIQKEFYKFEKELKKFLKKQKNVYLSIDCDVLKHVKATGYAEGEMKEKEIVKIFSVLLASEKVKWIDFVEYNPEKDKDGKSKKFCVSVLKRLVK